MSHPHGLIVSSSSIPLLHPPNAPFSLEILEGLRWAWKSFLLASIGRAPTSARIPNPSLIHANLPRSHFVGYSTTIVILLDPNRSPSGSSHPPGHFDPLPSRSPFEGIRFPSLRRHPGPLRRRNSLLGRLPRVLRSQHESKARSKARRAFLHVRVDKEAKERRNGTSRKPRKGRGRGPRRTRRSRRRRAAVRAKRPDRKTCFGSHGRA